jgi:hypothetical protein
MTKTEVDRFRGILTAKVGELKRFTSPAGQDRSDPLIEGQRAPDTNLSLAPLKCPSISMSTSSIAVAHSPRSFSNP